MIPLSQIADRFEKLLNKLPSPIRTPVEREWQPLKELFLHRRVPRIVLVGEGSEALLRGLLPEEAMLDHAAPWRSAEHVAGRLEFFIATPLHGEAPPLAPLAAAAPDLFLLTGESPEAVALLETLHNHDFARHKVHAPIVAMANAEPEQLEHLERLANRLYALPSLAAAVAAVLPSHDKAAALAAIARALPPEARLEFARLTGERTVQHEIARTLTRSAAAVCAAIGTQPIPLADLPILTALQGVMVAGIIYASGRKMSVATARDFLAAMGVNVGAAFLLREGTRAAAKLLPGWGNAVSGAVAGAGTYAIGIAATAYFIDGLPLEEAHKRLKLGRKRKKETAGLPPDSTSTPR